LLKRGRGITVADVQDRVHKAIIKFSMIGLAGGRISAASLSAECHSLGLKGSTLVEQLRYLKSLVQASQPSPPSSGAGQGKKRKRQSTKVSMAKPPLTKTQLQQTLQPLLCLLAHPARASTRQQSFRWFADMEKALGGTVSQKLCTIVLLATLCPEYLSSEGDADMVFILKGVCKLAFGSAATHAVDEDMAGLSPQQCLGLDEQQEPCGEALAVINSLQI
jgi:hypothetical protein